MRFLSRPHWIQSITLALAASAVAAPVAGAADLQIGRAHV